MVIFHSFLYLYQRVVIEFLTKSLKLAKGQRLTASGMGSKAPAASKAGPNSQATWEVAQNKSDHFVPLNFTKLDIEQGIWFLSRPSSSFSLELRKIAFLGSWMDRLSAKLDGLPILSPRKTATSAGKMRFQTFFRLLPWETTFHLKKSEWIRCCAPERYGSRSVSSDRAISPCDGSTVGPGHPSFRMPI